VSTASPIAAQPTPRDASAALFAARGRWLMLLSAVLFGAMSVSARALNASVPAAQVVVVRFAVGLVCVLAVRRWRPQAVRLTRPGLVFWRGLLGGMAVLLYFMAIERLGAGLGTLLNYIFPVWALVFARLWLGEPMRPRVVGGMALAIAGLVLVVGPARLWALGQGTLTPIVRAGLLCGLVSSVFAGAATTVVRAARRTDSALAIFGGFCLVGMLVALPSALADWRPVGPREALLLLVVGLLSFGAQALYSWSLGFVTAAEGALTTQLTVVATYALAALLLGELPTWTVVLGGVVVMAGVLLASTGRPTPPVASEEG